MLSESNLKQRQNDSGYHSVSSDLRTYHPSEKGEKEREKDRLDEKILVYQENELS